jgi:hypothetical protein
LISNQLPRASCAFEDNEGQVEGQGIRRDLTPNSHVVTLKMKARLNCPLIGYHPSDNRAGSNVVDWQC